MESYGAEGRNPWLSEVRMRKAGPTRDELEDLRRVSRRRADRGLTQPHQTPRTEQRHE